MAITIKNYRTARTDVLAAALEDLDEGDWELAEAIEDELAAREAEDDEMGQHYDSPDIYDTLGERPSYAS